MGPALTALAFTTFAAAMAFFISPKFFPGGKIRMCIVWIVAAACVFFIRDNLAALVAIGVALLVVAPLRNLERTLLYIAVFPAIPQFYGAQIPFPGLNYLIDIDFAKLAAIVLLGPVFVSTVLAPRPPALRAVDNLLLIFVLITSAMTFRDLPFTSVLRVTFDQFILIYVPYIAISRTLKTQEDLENAVKAFFAGIVVIAFVGVISVLKSWNYYTYAADSVSVKAFIDFRNNLLRIGSTLGPTLLAYIIGVGAVAALFLRSIKALPVYFIIGLLLVFGLTAFATGARGGWLAALATISLYLLLPRLNRVMRNIMLISLALVIVAGLVMIGQGNDFFDDKYGTFNYRAELLRTSFAQIVDRPLFGSSTFIESPRFAHLVQGEGIVDVVNGYLQIALSYGLVGLGLYLGANGLALRGCLSILGRTPPRRAKDRQSMSLQRTVALLTAAHLGLLAMLATVSATSYVPHYNYLILGLVVAQARVCVVRGAPKSARSAHEHQDGVTPPNAPREERPSPYGARFVRRI